jgi:hypothetical protein
MSPFGMPCVVGDAFDDEHAPRLIASPATMATATARRTEFQGREMVGVVHVHELAQQLAAEPGHRPEQALGQRAAGQPAAEIEHSLLVSGQHRPDHHRAPVPQQPGLLQFGGVPRH